MDSEKVLLESKTKSADVFELGMAKNNSAVLLTSHRELNDRSYDQMISAWKIITKKLFDAGKEIRKEKLGY